MPRSRKTFQILKPNGSFAPRVQLVGPQHFGVLVVDPAKARSKFAFSNFYGDVLLKPFWVEHTKPLIQEAIVTIQQTVEARNIKDLVVAIEMTGTYHQPILRAFRQHTQYDTRLLHPHATSQFRQPADPGNKTDDTDLAAQFRAATLGFGLTQTPLPDLYVELQTLCRHRRDLVVKNASLQCQIREVLHEAMPTPTTSRDPVYRLLLEGLGDLLRQVWVVLTEEIARQSKASPQAWIGVLTVRKMIDWLVHELTKLHPETREINGAAP